MTRLLARFALTLLAIIGLTVAAAAQTQTGELTGLVKTPDDLSLPGATVTVTSPALQGSRTVVSDENGAYSFRALPPGEYTVVVEMTGMETKTQRVIVELGRLAKLDITVGLAGITETVTVAASTESAQLNSTQVGANYSEREINTLPTGRTPNLIAELAPGLTANTPNAGQVTIAGAFAYDNVFLINGVDVNDNLFGTANAVYIEDAIEQTTVMTSGISAEYGRFSGGVVNMITKSGGNVFSGSGRLNLTNDSWTDETPYEDSRKVTRKDNLNKVYEGTFGGPILKDRIWFFSAGRYAKTTTSSALQQTGLQFNGWDENKRLELKGTGTIANGHTVTGNYINVWRDVYRMGASWMIDPRSAESPSFPNDLQVVSYNGVLNSRLLANLQYSRKKFGFRNTGGHSTNIVDSPIWSLGINTPGSYEYNAPYWDATDPEDRNNRQFAGSLAYFLSTPRTGSHDFKAGFDHFTSTRTGGNSQSATGYVFDADYVTNASGAPVFDSQGRLIPVFVPGESYVERWLATRGSQIDIRTLSLYAQDRWLLTPKVTLNLGVRYEKVRSEATGGIVGVDTDTIVPRLAASYDLKGDGKTVLQGSYAHYSGKYSESQFANNTSVGNPAVVGYWYDGPAGQGMDFAPGFDPANYTEVYYGSFPTSNIFFDKGLSSPVTKEISFSIGQELWGRGSAKLTFTTRDYSNFVEDYINDPSANGQVDVVFEGVDYGTFDKVVYRNSDAPQREYRGLLFQSNYRILDNLHVEGHWTMQLRNHGNFEGEGANTPGSTGLEGDYPEIYVPERNFPFGRTDDFQRHKVRIWAVYSQGLGRFGTFDIAPMFRIESPRVYSLTASNVGITAIQASRDPGYAQPPDTQTLYFGERGSQEFKGYSLMDLSLNYGIPVFKSLRPWVKFEVLNVFNNQKLIAWNTSIRPDATSPKDANGLPTGYTKGSTFGTGTSNAHYPSWRAGNTGGRTYLVYAGVRF
ncbi:MAG TPA: TonB-dependent receptor [Vicinamibacterales bacterium]|nr:TonB-dependent receptor [Vicinamibacterales bacterium]